MHQVWSKAKGVNSRTSEVRTMDGLPFHLSRFFFLLTRWEPNNLCIQKTNPQAFMKNWITILRSLTITSAHRRTQFKLPSFENFSICLNSKPIAHKTGIVESFYRRIKVTRSKTKKNGRSSAMELHRRAKRHSFYFGSNGPRKQH